MNAPRISVVMPAYNAGPYIRQAIESVLGQTEPALELIVVDDGSTDDTAAIVREAAAADPRVRLVQQPNSGKPAIARNRGIRESKGEIVCFLDADDVWFAEKLRTCLSILEARPDIDLVFHDVEHMAEDGSLTGWRGIGPTDFSHRVLARSRPIGEETYLCDEKALFFFMCTKITTIFPSAAMIRRSRLFREPMFFAEDLLAGEDVDLWFRIVKTGGIAYVDRVFSGYRIHGQSVTRRVGQNVVDAVQAHVRNYSRSIGFIDRRQRVAYRQRIAAGLSSLGYRCSTEGRYDEALVFYCRSLWWRPRKDALKGLIKASGLKLLRGGGMGRAEAGR